MLCAPAAMAATTVRSVTPRHEQTYTSVPLPAVEGQRRAGCDKFGSDAERHGDGAGIAVRNSDNCGTSAPAVQLHVHVVDAAEAVARGDRTEAT